MTANIIVYLLLSALAVMAAWASATPVHRRRGRPVEEGIKSDGDSGSREETSEQRCQQGE